MKQTDWTWICGGTLLGLTFIMNFSMYDVPIVLEIAWGFMLLCSVVVLIVLIADIISQETIQEVREVK